MPTLRWTKWFVSVVLLAVVGVALLGSESVVAGEETALLRGALWHVVHGLCVPGERGSNDPSPCLRVDLSSGENRGFAVLRNPFEPNSMLIVPTRRIVGIEDPQLLTPNAPNYWADAWRQRDLLDFRSGGALPRDWVAMAVNSAYGRSQDQLHIHLSCVRADVRLALIGNQSRLGNSWQVMRFGSAGPDYLVRKITSENLDQINPFHLLAREHLRVNPDMSEQTLIVVGAFFESSEPGFYILSNEADLRRGDQASGAELLDTQCEIAP